MWVQCEELVLTILNKNKYSDMTLTAIDDTYNGGIFLKLRMPNLFSEILDDFCTEVEDYQYELHEVEMNEIRNTVMLTFKPASDIDNDLFEIVNN